MEIRRLSNAVLLVLALLLASCAAKKTVTNPTLTTTTPTAAKQDGAGTSLRFVQQVADQRLYQKNIVADMTFSLKAGSIDQSLPGVLRMRRDEVIRLQVMAPILQIEVGRVEFTPTYVLVIDRLHKEYIKAEYTELSFLKDNGLDFYSLQSLFWNELLAPGIRKLGEADLDKFAADLTATGSEVPLTLSAGKLHFTWRASRTDYKILSALVAYAGGSGARSQLTWNYADFKAVGAKWFPASQQFTFNTNLGGKAQQATVGMRMSSLRTDANWEGLTTPSAKYKKVEARDVFDKLLNIR